MQSFISRRSAPAAALAFAACFCAGVFVATPLNAATQVDASSANVAPAPVEDAVVDFLKQTTGARLTAIELGRMAQQRESSPSLSAYAKGMVGEETLLLERLQTLAGKLGVDIPSAPTEKNAEKLERFQAKPQEDFEKAFWNFLSDTYQRDLVTFEFASSIQNLDIRQFAIQHREMFQRQLDEIATLMKSGT